MRSHRLHNAVLLVLLAGLVAVGAPAAGQVPPLLGSISGVVWFDNDADGARETEEIGYQGISVDLTGAGLDGTFGTGDDEQFAAVNSDAAGGYRFSDLLPGTYRVTATVPTNPALRLTNGSATRTVTLAPAEQRVGPDFGLQFTRCQVSGVFEVCFMDAQDGAVYDNTVHERLRRLFAVTSGSSSDIRVAMYEWEDEGSADEVAEELERRHDAGVDVRVVVDENIQSAVLDGIFRDAVGTPVPVKVCAESCIGDEGGGGNNDTDINHNKLFLVKTASGTKYVAISSANLKISNRYNNLLIVRDDGNLYSFFEKYWNRMNKSGESTSKWQNDDDGDGTLEASEDWLNNVGYRDAAGSSNYTRGYAFPRNGDMVAAILANVTDCRAGDQTIWVASAFVSGRPEVRYELDRLEDVENCDVKVVTLDEADEAWMEADTGAENLTNTSVQHLCALHDKFMLVDAYYNGAWHQVVFTGSHNLTYGANYQNDESWLRVESSFVYGQYQTQFNTKLWALADDGTQSPC